MAKTYKILGALAVLVTLGACEATDTERTAMGAAGGYLAADVLGTNRAGGALIGGVLGATCDNTTTLC